MHKKIFLFSILYFLFSVNSVSAAEVYFNPAENNIGIDQKISVEALVDTEKQEINAVEGKILYPADILKLENIYNGDSLVLFWIKKPEMIKPGEIEFSGIIPNGFMGREGKFFTLDFITKKEGGGSVNFNSLRILLNDGEGTNLSVEKHEFSFLVEKDGTSPVIATTADIQPPDEFNVEIIEDPEIYEGRKFLVFATQDKGSGIDYYAVREGDIGPYVVAESPYLLRDQNLRQEIKIKAVDKAGNSRIVIVNKVKDLPWYKNYWILVIIILALVATAFKSGWIEIKRKNVKSF